MKVFLITFILLISNNLFSQQLKELHQLAIKNNSNLKSIYKEYQRVYELSKGSSSLPDPSITFGYAINPIETKNGSQSKSIGVSQNFPWFGTLSTMEKSRYQMAQSLYFQWINQKKILIKEIDNALADYNRIKQILKLKKELLNNILQIKNLQQAKVASSSSNSIFLLEINETIREILNDTITLHTKLSNIFDQLIYLVNDSNFNIENFNSYFDSISIKNITINQFDFNQHPSIITINKAIKSAEFYKNVAQKKGLPSFMIGLNYLFIDNNSASPNSGDDAIVAAIGIKLPIYRSKYRRHIEASNIKIEELKYKRDNISKKLIKELNNSINNIKQLVISDSILISQIKIKQQQIQLLKAMYSSSLVDFERLLNFMISEIKYQIKRVNVKFDYIKELNNISYLTYNYKSGDEK